MVKNACNVGDPDLISGLANTLAWRIPWTEEPGGYSPWGHKELDMTECMIAYTHKHTHISLGQH